LCIGCFAQNRLQRVFGVEQGLHMKVLTYSGLLSVMLMLGCYPAALRDAYELPAETEAVQALPVTGVEEDKPPPGTPAETKVPLPNSEGSSTRTLPINLPTALRLAGVNPLDIALASERLQQAEAELQRAQVLWLPTIFLGADYFRHDGRIQDVAGHLFDTSKQSLMLGASPGVLFAVTDAIYAPLVARQVTAAKQSELQAVRNDVLLEVAEAYFAVQQARGEVLGLAATLQRTEDLGKRVDRLVEAGLVPGLERSRVTAEIARRRQALENAYERWKVASAELNRILRLEATALVVPLEPPHWRIELVEPNRDLDDLAAVALRNRPELASQRALVEATLTQVRQERWRPLLPTVVIRGAATNPGGTLAGGYFGGGLNDDLGAFGWRNSIDFQLLWQFQNLGLGNDAVVRQQEAVHQQALLQFFRLRDRILAQVVQAHAQLQSALRRVRLAEEELKQALATVQISLEGIQQTKAIGGVPILVIRPQEVVAAIGQLDQAYRDYYAAVADSNRAQFRLYHALGQPAQLLIESAARSEKPRSEAPAHDQPAKPQP
jgi:outer membrane protein TolC